MYKASISLIRKPKYLIQFSLFLIAFLIIYFVIDYLNMPYDDMANTYGIGLVITNVFLNLLMAISSAFLMHLSTSMVELKGREGKGSSLGFISIVFGILTYGCTSCVIAFFASLGIAFSVIALPLAGLPYKFISLLLIALGLWIVIRQLNHGACKVKLD